MHSTWTPAEYESVESIFFSDLNEKKKAINDRGIKFSYYTSADVAKSVLESKRIWMRNTQTMNDPSEVMYGMHLMNKLRESPTWNRFKLALDAVCPDQVDRLIDVFDAWTGVMKSASFITCVSEHDPEEDQHGRLSMWRAYGGRNGMALIFKAAAMSLDNEFLAVQAMPVYYFTESDFIKNFSSIVDKLEERKTRQRIEIEAFPVLVTRFLSLMLLCTKHPGFREEREWRVIAQPFERSSDFLEKKVEIVRGTPQIVLKMRLEEQLDKAVKGVNLSDLIDKIIIGPCDFPEISREAMHELMVKADIQSPDEKLIVSGIPLRNF